MKGRVSSLPPPLSLFLSHTVEERDFHGAAPPEIAVQQTLAEKKWHERFPQ